jgi:hypothetical protein
MKNPLRKKSRYQKARKAVREMISRKRPARQHHAGHARSREHVLPGNDTAGDLEGLHWLTAGLFVAAGVEAAIGERRGDYRPDPIRWAPLVAAPIAGAAQAARAIWPSSTTRMVAQLANGVALGVGAAGLASSVSSAMASHDYDADETQSLLDRMPSLAPLAFGAIGLLGLLLDSDELDDLDEEEEDSRRYRVVVRV